MLQVCVIAEELPDGTMNNLVRRAIIVGILLASSVGFQSHAATISYSWTGSVVGVVFDNGSSFYSGTQVGDTFSGNFIYDPDDRIQPFCGRLMSLAYFFMTN
jgi:hypothetical protein